MSHTQTLSGVASGVLSASAAIGIYILLTDSYLWSAAPSHADGLIVFVLLDLGLVAGQWLGPHLASVGMILLGLIQFGAMGADLFVGASFGTSLVGAQSGFQQYLLGDTAFKALLGVQVLVIVVGLLTLVSSRRLLRAGPPAVPGQPAPHV